MVGKPAPATMQEGMSLSSFTFDVWLTFDTGDNDFSFYKAAGKLKGKKTIVTGGDSGIGRAVAAMFAMEGADVRLCFLVQATPSSLCIRLRSCTSLRSSATPRLRSRSSLLLADRRSSSLRTSGMSKAASGSSTRSSRPGAGSTSSSTTPVSW